MYNRFPASWVIHVVMTCARLRAAALTVGMCLLEAGCGTVAARDASAQLAGSRSPAAFVRPSITTPGQVTASRAIRIPPRCARTAVLSDGMTVGAWRLGSVRFTSLTTAVALTAPWIPCDIPLGPGQGVQGVFLAQQVRLAVTRDGGHHWVTKGRALPSAVPEWATEQIAAVVGGQVWALVGEKLYEIGDGGSRWTAVPLPGRVASADAVSGRLWALLCPRAGQIACRPEVYQIRVPTGTWTREPLPVSWAALDPQLDVSSAQDAVVVTNPAMPNRKPALIRTTDGGARWTVVGVPPGPGRMCRGLPVSFTAAGAEDWWLLCTGGAAAGSTTRALLRSTDAGRTWPTMSAVSRLDTPLPAYSLSRAPIYAIAATSSRVWLALDDGLAESADGGKTWTLAGNAAQGSGWTSFDVWSATRAWLLDPGNGLWQTTDGTTWRPIGGAHLWSHR
jgi:hypothetical protein